MGRGGHIQMGPALDPAILKIRVVMHAPSEGALAETARDGIEAFLRQIRQLAAVSVAMDCGHRHSSVLPEVAIWLRPAAKAKEDSLDGQCPGEKVDKHSTPTMPSPSMSSGIWLNKEKLLEQLRSAASQQQAAAQKALASALTYGLVEQELRASPAAVQSTRVHATPSTRRGSSPAPSGYKYPPNPTLYCTAPPDDPCAGIGQALQ